VLEGIYSHVNGADDLFRIIQSKRREVGSNDPLDEKHIETIQRTAKEPGWQCDLPITLLSAQFKVWLGDNAGSSLRTGRSHY